MNHQSNPSTKQGMALFGVLMILVSLSLIAGTAFIVVKSNVAVAGFQKRHQESFYQADAGVHYVQNQLSIDLRSGAVDLDQDSVPLNYSAPTGYAFDPVTNVTRLANNDRFLIEVTGRSLSASTTIEAVLGRQNALGNIGVFGDRELRIQPGFDIYSYFSSLNINPTPSDSSGAAGVGSNRSVTVQPGVSIDGTILLGATSDGTPAVVSGAGTIPVSDIPRVAPDPLGAIGGGLAASFVHYSSSLNNDNAAAGIVGNSIDLGSHDSLTLHSGYYYLDEFTLGSHAELHVESTPDNPAVIFLTGALRCQPSTEFFSSSGSPRSLYVFSNSTQEFRIQPRSEFRGFVYAPYADLRIQPGGDMYGVFWGGKVRLQPNGDLYIDLGLLEDFLSGTLEVVQWKEIR